MKTTCCVWLTLLLLSLSALKSSAQEWTRFRGPNGTGIGQARQLPSKWSENDFNWRIPLPGTGHSSPVLWGDRIFLTSTDEPNQRIYAFCVMARDGKIAWQKEFSLTGYPRHRYNSFASSTATTDDQRVYFTYLSVGHYKVVALTHGGDLVWEKDLGSFQSQHGPGTSPILYENKLILARDQDGDSSLIAFDPANGAVKWETNLDGKQADYSTPCLYEAPGGKPLLIFNSMENGIAAFQPTDGKKVWEYSSAFDKRSVSSPVLASGLLIGSCGSGGGGIYLVAVKPPGSDGSKGPELAYEIRRSAPYVPTSVAVGDLLFLWSDAGIVTCVHAPSGKDRWQERVGGDFFGSPVCIDDRIFCISTTGEVVVLAASDRFQVLARNQLHEMTHATPAVAGGRLYIRTASSLISVGGKNDSR